MVLGLHELVDLDVSLNTVLIECALQDLVVLDEFILVLSIPLDLAKLKGSSVKTVHHCAVNRASGALFNLSQLKLVHEVSKRGKHLHREVR